MHAVLCLACWEHTPAWALARFGPRIANRDQLQTARPDRLQVVLRFAILENTYTPARSAPYIVALMDQRHPRVTRVTRVTSESVENTGSVKICEGSAKSTVKLNTWCH